jgi:hypothetical protein
MEGSDRCLPELLAYALDFRVDELEMFELTEISALPDRIRGLLSDGSAISALADRGRIRAKKDCTLFARADELADDLLSAL